VVFGIRPDDIHDPRYTPADIKPAPIEARVDVTEMIGNEVFMHLVAGDFSFVGRIDPRTEMKVGEHTQLVFNMDNMHLFSPEGDQEAL
jgi:multiple sugar transport system ATP-binding protein